MPVTDGKTIHHSHIICSVHDIIWHRQTQTSLNLPHQIFKINCAKMFAPFFTLVYCLAMPCRQRKSRKNCKNKHENWINLIRRICFMHNHPHNHRLEQKHSSAFYLYNVRRIEEYIVIWPKWYSYRKPCHEKYIGNLELLFFSLSPFVSLSCVCVCLLFVRVCSPHNVCVSNSCISHDQIKTMCLKVEPYK